MTAANARFADPTDCSEPGLQLGGGGGAAAVSTFFACAASGGSSPDPAPQPANTIAAGTRSATPLLQLISELSQLLRAGAVVRSERLATVNDMAKTTQDPAEHRHTARTTHLLARRSGVPYEVERKVCTACLRVLDERPLRRAAA
jgi:hypothetical protein